MDSKQISTLKRYVISTSETFIAWFLGVFLLQLDSVISSWSLPTKELLVSAIIWGTIAGVKLAIKPIRENRKKIVEKAIDYLFSKIK